jgi:hypothetical protein
MFGMGELSLTPLEREVLKKISAAGGRARTRNLTKKELRAIGLMGAAAQAKKRAEAKREAANAFVPPLEVA